jgi:hypothetical protein
MSEARIDRHERLKDRAALVTGAGRIGELNPFDLIWRPR